MLESYTIKASDHQLSTRSSKFIKAGKFHLIRGGPLAQKKSHRVAVCPLHRGLARHNTGAAHPP
jgi:hypothetical protein